MSHCLICIFPNISQGPVVYQAAASEIRASLQAEASRPSSAFHGAAMQPEAASGYSSTPADKPTCFCGKFPGLCKEFPGLGCKLARDSGSLYCSACKVSLTLSDSIFDIAIDSYLL